MHELSRNKQTAYINGLWSYVILEFSFLCRYNKREEDFPSLREYNDFLEEVEEIGMF